MSTDDRSTSLVLSSASSSEGKTRGERFLSRLTLGHLLAGTLLGGALMGGAVTQALQEGPKPERVIPSIVFNWNLSGNDVRMDAPSDEPVHWGNTCKPGAFLGIEFRRDDSFSKMARLSNHRRSLFQLNRPFAPAVHNASGVTVLNVLHGTAAEAMGLLPGDVIVEMDNVAVRSAAQLASVIRERCVGEATKLRVHRGEQVKMVTGNLRSRYSRRCEVRR